jgi:hypothetical protein
MQWNVCTTDAQNFPMRVLALNGCHHRGVFTVVKVVPSQWSVVRSAVTHLHTF